MRFKLTDALGLVKFIDDVEYWGVGNSGDLFITSGRKDSEGRCLIQIGIAAGRWVMFERVS